MTELRIRHWYRDRDFPEIKGQVQNAPTEIIAVVEDTKGLDRLIAEHNGALDQMSAQLAEKDAEHAAEMEKDWVVFTKHLAEKDAEIARLKEAGTPYWKERDLMNSYVLRVSDLEPQLAALTEALEHLAKQQTPEEYEEAENAELDADTGLEAYERMVLAARAALETARTR